MLIRQKIILRLLVETAKPLAKTVFVKLVFLLRSETCLQNVSTFYDFVPYHFGPFSFTLYSELARLQTHGLVNDGPERIELNKASLTRSHALAEGVTPDLRSAVTSIVRQYGQVSRPDLVSTVYRNYPWFALNSKLPEGQLAAIPRPDDAPPAAYTTGYQGKSVDAFLNGLLKKGIRTLIDVRANPISRKHGFSGKRLGQLCQKLNLTYVHVPSLGIPSGLRTGLVDLNSYKSLLDEYERSTLQERPAEIREVGERMNRSASVLVCFEEDTRCCHRTRLANAIANDTGLKVVHL